MAAKTLLPALRERVRRIEQGAARRHGAVPLGLAAIDRALPEGGLARGALHEILGAGGDEEDGALAASFAAFVLGRIAKEGIVLWCLARADLYGPGIAAMGLDPARIVFARAPREGLALWAMEEGLRTPGLATVVGEIGRLDMVASRRLQLAAEHSGIPAFLIRRWRDGDEAARERSRPNAAATRWRVAAFPSRPPTTGAGLGWGLGIGRICWRLELLRCRGGAPATWELLWDMEAADAADTPSVAAAMADRPPADGGCAARRRTG